jgi:hypothetical protein
MSSEEFEVAAGPRLYDRTTDITYAEAMRILTKGNQMRSRENPLIILKYGPPGSGKSSSDPIIYNMFGLSEEDFIHIDFDEVLESSKELRHQTAEVRRSEPEPTSNNLNKAGKLKSVISRFVDVRSKHTTGVKSQSEPSAYKTHNEGLHNWGLLSKVHAVLQESLDRNYHIMYDITGVGYTDESKYYQRLLLSIPKVYRIVIVYPYISRSIQQERAFARANGFMQQEFPMYGRITGKETRKSVDQSSRDFFKNTLMPMFFSGMIYKILMYDNQERMAPNFNEVVDINFASVPENRHNPLRVSPLFPVEVDNTGILKAIEVEESSRRNHNNAAGESILSIDRLGRLINRQSTEFNSLEGGRRRSTHRKKRTNRRKTRR